LGSSVSCSSVTCPAPSTTTTTTTSTTTTQTTTTTTTPTPTGCVGLVACCINDTCVDCDCNECIAHSGTPLGTGTFCDLQNPNQCSICGNGNVDPGEQCDDGNSIENDCCDNCQCPDMSDDLLTPRYINRIFPLPGPIEVGGPSFGTTTDGNDFTPYTIQPIEFGDHVMLKFTIDTERDCLQDYSGTVTFSPQNSWTDPDFDGTNVGYQGDCANGIVIPTGLYTVSSGTPLQFEVVCKFIGTSGQFEGTHTLSLANNPDCNVTYQWDPWRKNCGDNVTNADEQCDDGGLCVSYDQYTLYDNSYYCDELNPCPDTHPFCFGSSNTPSKCYNLSNSTISQTPCASSGDCPTGGQNQLCLPFGGDGCSAHCTIEECGNGILDVGEQCDDGNDFEYDDCKNDCTPFVCPPLSANIVGACCEPERDCYMCQCSWCSGTWYGPGSSCSSITCNATTTTTTSTVTSGSPVPPPPSPPTQTETSTDTASPATVIDLTSSSGSNSSVSQEGSEVEQAEFVGSVGFWVLMIGLGILGFAFIYYVTCWVEYGNPFTKPEMPTGIRATWRDEDSSDSYSSLLGDNVISNMVNKWTKRD